MNTIPTLASGMVARVLCAASGLPASLPVTRHQGAWRRLGTLRRLNGGGMKRVFGYVLVTVGFTLIFLSPFLLFYATPRLEKAPTDTQEQIVSTGRGTYFSAKQLKAVTTPVKDIEVLSGQPQK